MILKWLFDRLAALLGLICLSWVYVIVAIMIKIKMPGPVLFVQKRVGKGGKLFNCHKFRSMRVRKETEAFTGVAAAETSRITPFGLKLRRYKLDELPELWDVLIGKMSFVGPRPDVPGYADQLVGEDRDILRLRPGITGPASLKYRDEEDMIADFVAQVQDGGCPLPEGMLAPSFEEMNAEEIAQWYNDHVIYPDKVRLNLYYLRHYSFMKDIQMIFATVLGKHIRYADEVI